MEPTLTLPWLCGALLLAAGALSSCQHAPQQPARPEPPETGLYRPTALLTTALPDGGAPKKPKPGRKPRTTTDYNSAIEAVKQYRNNHGSGEILNGYFSKKLLKDLLANSKCEGVRVYLADSAGQARMVVIGVDKDGADLVTPVELEQQGLGGKFTQGQYLLGISEERCPNNCEGSGLYQ